MPRSTYPLDRDEHAASIRQGPTLPRGGREPAAAEQARGVHTTWNYTLGTVLFSFVVLCALLAITATQAVTDSGDITDALLLVTLLASAATQLRFCWFLRAGLGGGLPRPIWTIALVVPAVASWLLGFFSPDEWLRAAMPLWMASCLLTCLLPSAWRWALLAAGFALLVAPPVVTAVVAGRVPFLDPSSTSGPDTVFMLLYAVFLPVMLLSSLWWWQIVVRLDGHRRTAADLAVTQERLRFAADLHDIQGHHLQVIALKTELAERLLTIDVDLARSNVHEARMIAKRALEETRSLVGGYRQVALGNELDNAREVLTAAGAHCDLDLDALPIAENAQHAFAMTAREATTNILRHSEASSVSIRLRGSPTGHLLRISNDGAHAPDTLSQSAGSGIEGLRARIEHLDGNLTTTFIPEEHRFELRAWIPSQTEATP